MSAVSPPLKMEAGPNSPSEVAAALRPFRVAETLDVACGYERSFKMTRGLLLAQRYLLGIQRRLVAGPGWLQAFRELDAPAAFVAALDSLLEAADMVFLGSEIDAAGHACCKIYLEFGCATGRSPGDGGPPGIEDLTHRGFKWRSDDPSQRWVTDYRLIRSRDEAALHAGIRRLCGAPRRSTLAQDVLAIVERATANTAVDRLLLLEAGESGNPRHSLDVNLYPAGMPLASVEDVLGRAARRLDVPADGFARLMDIVRARPLGHLSAGLDRHGQQFLTVYFEA